MFSSEFCEIFKSTFFSEHLRTTASAEGLIVYLLFCFHIASQFVRHPPDINTKYVNNGYFSPCCSVAGMVQDTSGTIMY